MERPRRDCPLPEVNPWVKRLGEATGFVQPLTYLERRQLLERAL